jgi:hypothetical protein
VQKRNLFVLFIVQALALIETVKADAFEDNGISVYAVKQQIGIALGFIGPDALVVGGFILGLIFLSMVMLPAVFLLRKSGAAFAYLIVMGLAVIGVNVAMGLFPWWILLIEAMFIALMFSGVVRGWISGS